MQSKKNDISLNLAKINLESSEKIYEKINKKEIQKITNVRKTK